MRNITLDTTLAYYRRTLPSKHTGASCLFTKSNPCVADFNHERILNVNIMILTVDSGSRVLLAVEKKQTRSDGALLERWN